MAQSIDLMNMNLNLNNIESFKLKNQTQLFNNMRSMIALSKGTHFKGANIPYLPETIRRPDNQTSSRIDKIDLDIGKHRKTELYFKIFKKLTKDMIKYALLTEDHFRNKFILMFKTYINKPITVPSVRTTFSDYEQELKSQLTEMANELKPNKGSLSIINPTVIDVLNILTKIKSFKKTKNNTSPDFSSEILKEMIKEPLNELLDQQKEIQKQKSLLSKDEKIQVSRLIYNIFHISELGRKLYRYHMDLRPILLRIKYRSLLEISSDYEQILNSEMMHIKNSKHVSSEKMHDIMIMIEVLMEYYETIGKPKPIIDKLKKKYMVIAPHVKNIGEISKNTRKVNINQKLNNFFSAAAPNGSSKYEQEIILIEDYPLTEKNKNRLKTILDEIEEYFKEKSKETESMKYLNTFREYRIIVFDKVQSKNEVSDVILFIMCMLTERLLQFAKEKKDEENAKQFFAKLHEKLEYLKELMKRIINGKPNKWKPLSDFYDRKIKAIIKIINGDHKNENKAECEQLRTHYSSMYKKENVQERIRDEYYKQYNNRNNASRFERNV